MKRNGWILIIAAMIFWGIGISFGQAVEKRSQCVSLRYQEAILTKKEMKKIEKEEEKKAEQVVFTLWDNLEEEEWIGENGRKGKGSVQIVSGDLSLLVSEFFLSGSIGYTEDWRGCVIEETAAYELFGSVSVAGKKLEWEGKEYVIRGIVKGNHSRIWVRDTEEERGYRFLEIQFPYGQNASQQANQFLTQYGLDQPKGILDGYFIGEIARMCYFIPAWILFFLIGIRLIKNTYELKELPFLFSLAILITVFAFIMLKFASQFQFSFPEKMIPTKWSDFSFWTNLFQKAKENLENLSHMVPVNKDQEMKRKFFLCILCSVTASFCLAIYQRKWVGTKLEETIWSVLFFLFIPYTCILFLSFLGIEFLPPFCFYYIVPITIFIRFMINKWEVFCQKRKEVLLCQKL